MLSACALSSGCNIDSTFSEPGIRTCVLYRTLTHGLPQRDRMTLMTLKGTLAFTVVSSLLLCLQAGGAPHPPAAAELQLLQGTWEGIVVGDKGTSKNPDLQKTS